MLHVAEIHDIERSGKAGTRPGGVLADEDKLQAVPGAGGEGTLDHGKAFDGISEIAADKQDGGGNRGEAERTAEVGVGFACAAELRGIDAVGDHVNMPVASEGAGAHAVGKVVGGGDDVQGER